MADGAVPPLYTRRPSQVPAARLVARLAQREGALVLLLDSVYPGFPKNMLIVPRRSVSKAAVTSQIQQNGRPLNVVPSSVYFFNHSGIM